MNPDLVRKGVSFSRCALHAARRVLGQLRPQGQEGLDEDGLRHDVRQRRGRAEARYRLGQEANNIKPDIGFFGEALNWGGGAKGDDLAARAKRNGCERPADGRDSGALSQQEIKRMDRRAAA